MRNTWVYAFLALGAVVISCGGAADTGLFGDAPAGGDVPDGAASSDAAGAHPDGGTRGDGGGHGDGGGGMDGSVPIEDASTGKDSSPPPLANTIDCNTAAMTCKVGAQVCCRSGDTPPSFNCAASAGCNAFGNMPIPCDDADDCDKLGHPGDLCCAQTVAGKANSVSCQAAGSCVTNATNLCDPLAGDPCPNGGTCQVSVTTLPGFHICF
ncbi:MAG: hypothetical protein ABIP39_11350 [Polyangiaceae bacterium]